MLALIGAEIDGAPPPDGVILRPPSSALVKSLFIAISDVIAITRPLETPVIPFAVRAVIQRNRDHVANRDKRGLKLPKETG